VVKVDLPRRVIRETDTTVLLTLDDSIEVELQLGDFAQLVNCLVDAKKRISE
jgi:hypothetical protein